MREEAEGGYGEGGGSGREDNIDSVVKRVTYVSK